MSVQGKTRSAAVLAVAVIALAGAPSAQADHDPVIPSRDAVDQAEQNVEAAQRSVADIQADLAAASQRLDDLAVAAEQAAEAYNGAVVAWQDAKGQARQARTRADQAAVDSADARDSLATYFLSQDNTASGLTSFNATMTADGTHSLISELADADASTRALDAQYQTFAAASDLADVYEQAAEDALADADAAKAAADQARQEAQDAVAAQQAAVASIADQRAALMAELARAQDISVSLATQRQEGLEQRREAREAAERRAELRRQERQERRAEERRQQREQQQEQQQQQHHDGGGNGGGNGGGGNGGGGNGGGNGGGHHGGGNPSPNPPSPSGGAQAAINFAYDQLGEPYVWGAAGPDSWDCSGLTMGAWAAAGVSLSHYSVSQYYETTPITYSQLQPGDLIFWASDASNPQTIFHVALYIGGGKMIQAPRTGRNVEVQDVWYWESPDFFGRVG